MRFSSQTSETRLYINIAITHRKSDTSFIINQIGIHNVPHNTDARPSLASHRNRNSMTDTLARQ